MCTALISAVVDGPVAISVAAGGLGWQLYGGGVFDGKGLLACNFDQDHAVQLVGYGVEGTDEYWIVRHYDPMRSNLVRPLSGNFRPDLLGTLGRYVTLGVLGGAKVVSSGSNALVRARSRVGGIRNHRMVTAAPVTRHP